MKTLYLPEYFELFPWILNQTELEIIAVYSSIYFWGSNRDKHLNRQRWLSSSPCFQSPPTFFILSPEDQEMNVIHAFLTFSPGWSAKLVADSLKYFYAIPHGIKEFGLYVQNMDELDDENLLSVTRLISDHFAKIHTLLFSVGDSMIHLVRPPVFCHSACCQCQLMTLPKRIPKLLPQYSQALQEDFKNWVLNFGNGP